MPRMSKKQMYLMALKSNGVLMMNDHLPHTPQTIATYTRHQIGTVERALKVFIEFGLVEVLTDGAFYMADMQLLIGQSSTEGERKKKERMKLECQKRLPGGTVDKCPSILEYIEKLSAYMESTGKRYNSHAATIRRWASEDSQKATSGAKGSGLPDYTYKEVESL